MYNQVILFGDSIIKYNKNFQSNWAKALQNKIKLKKRQKINFHINAVVGLNSRVALEKLPKIFDKINKKSIILIQIGLNDSWHFKSLNGNPNVSISAFSANINEIILKLKSCNSKKIFMINYHNLLNERIEINNKNLNQNLYKYNLMIKKLSKKNKIKLIDIRKKTLKINPKKICRPLPDGIHLSKSGENIYANIIFDEIKKYFK
tara:strand:- start:885 stop:1499 length:615 start_codon:yes stop_codon:yes gene_type:complete